MSNVTVVLFVLSILGAGACIFALTLFKENKALKAKLALSQENHRRNADILREYQVLCGDLEEECDDRRMFMGLMEADLGKLVARNAFLETSAANGWKDAAEKWDSLLEARKEINDLKEKVETLEAWIGSPPPVPTSKPAFAQDEDGIW